ncbi:MAG: cell envelope biogenesis protein TolA [Marinovum algicola]|uniref:Cell division and transport-associated protein TolA n=2 Tax=Marinovum algicola TaxID=42444 RepID=A0A975ZLC4_9RHOB|nr:cell envelope biogenesis protein TolA [Marinovum algicola]SEI52004.1 Cell division and transport-associated protein TolA [Marinovum algicola]SLN30036.1 hypothetical protein MAA5396_01370 [Marinovum algicola]
MSADQDIPEAGRRRLHFGYYVSGAAHVGLIGWLLIGPLFEVEPLPFDVTSVTTISEADYAALTGQDTPEDATPEVAPAVPDAPEEPAPPAAEDTPPPAPVEEPPAPVTPPEPVEEPPAPAPETLPDVPEPPAPVLSEPDDIPPPEPAPPADEDVAVVLPEVSQRPQPRPAPRVAPEPVAPPEPEVAIEDTTRDAVVAEEDSPTPEPQEEQEATAEEEATSEIVTEAAETPSGAPERSVRPRGRPPAPPAVAEAPQESPETPRQAPAPADDPAPAADGTADAVADALAEALGGGDTPAPAPTAASGPPLTAGERENLRLAVQDCWVVDVGSAAARVTVVVSMEMEQSGRVITSSIRLTGSEGGDARATEVAFQAARRAIIRCQKDGYELPVDKYDQWRQIEMTFNPEKVSR